MMHRCRIYPEGKSLSEIQSNANHQSCDGDIRKSLLFHDVKLPLHTFLENKYLDRKTRLSMVKICNNIGNNIPGNHGQFIIEMQDAEQHSVRDQRRGKADIATLVIWSVIMLHCRNQASYHLTYYSVGEILGYTLCWSNLCYLQYWHSASVSSLMPDAPTKVGWTTCNTQVSSV